MAFKIKIFADGADAGDMKAIYKTNYISGFTTNPTLMKRVGVTDYAAFARHIAEEITDLPLSFEVFADDFGEMARQARIIGAWGKNVYVKIPITNTKGDSAAGLIRELSGEGLKLNITAILTLSQVETALNALSDDAVSIVSVFAGRIADTGIDPCIMMEKTAKLCKAKSGQTESLWASTRELYNIFQAEQCGVDIITVTSDILKKLPLVGKDLTALSLETVKMFREDAVKSGYKL